VFHLFNQYRSERRVKLFEASAGFGPGEQRRDFVSVADVVQANLYLLDHPQHSGIFNVGTGRAQTFNQVAAAVVNALREAEGERPVELAQMQADGQIEYTPFPAGLKEKYQSYTQADISRLRRAGYAAPFLTVEQGVERYVKWLLER
jgi:ADP-L-glycero-D-manno-heptose 6-epimerase